MARTTISIDDNLIERAKDAGLNVSKLTRDALKETLDQPLYHFFNTNKGRLPGKTTGTGVYGHGVVATYSNSEKDQMEEFGGHIGDIRAGDRILSWENDYGIRAVGIALEDGNSDPVPPEQRLFHSISGNIHEYHAPVNWVAVLDPQDALTADEVQRIAGSPIWARGTHAILKSKQHPELLWDLVRGRALR